MSGSSATGPQPQHGAELVASNLLKQPGAGFWVLTPGWRSWLCAPSSPRWVGKGRGGACVPGGVPGQLLLCFGGARLLPSFVIPCLPPLVYVRVPLLRLSEISFPLCGQETDFNCLYFLFFSSYFVLSPLPLSSRIPSFPAPLVSPSLLPLPSLPFSLLLPGSFSSFLSQIMSLE